MTPGTPDILWTDIAFVKEADLIYTHGNFYNCSNQFDQIEIASGKDHKIILDHVGEEDMPGERKYQWLIFKEQGETYGQLGTGRTSDTVEENSLCWVGPGSWLPIAAGKFNSVNPTGAPLTVASKELVKNLNVDLLDGYDAQNLQSQIVWTNLGMGSSDQKQILIKTGIKHADARRGYLSIKGIFTGINNIYPNVNSILTFHTSANNNFDLTTITHYGFSNFKAKLLVLSNGTVAILIEPTQKDNLTGNCLLSLELVFPEKASELVGKNAISEIELVSVEPSSLKSVEAVEIGDFIDTDQRTVEQDLSQTTTLILRYDGIVDLREEKINCWTSIYVPLSRLDQYRKTYPTLSFKPISGKDDVMEWTEI